MFDEPFYTSVIHACGLSDDLEKLGGDQTFVGDKGMTLSGGQRMRVALARAIYQKKQIYLFDDILSCLDVHVANHVIKYCILGLLANTTRVVVSDQRFLHRRAAQILHFDDGHMIVHDPVNLYPSYVSDEDEDEQIGGENWGDPVVGDKSPQTLKTATQREEDLGGTASGEEHFEESVESGSLKNKTLSAYWNAVTTKLGISVLLSVIFMQITRNYSDILLAQWVATSFPDDNSTQGQRIEEDSERNLLGFYSGVVIANSILTLARSFLFAYAGIKAAIFIHDKLLTRVINVSSTNSLRCAPSKSHSSIP